MTTAFTITRPSAAKELPFIFGSPNSDLEPTAIAADFASLLDLVSDALACERDLTNAQCWDPAYSDFSETAEHQWQECLLLASDLFTAPVTTLADRPLQRMSMLLHFLIESESLDDALRFQSLLRANQELFTTEDADRQQALHRAERHVNTLVELAYTAEQQLSFAG